MVNIVFLGGYSNSGKSTLARNLVKLEDWTVISTSDMLYSFLGKMLNTLTGYETDAGYCERLIHQFKREERAFEFIVNDEAEQTGFGSHELTGRELLVTAAEEWLVPTFGREIFAHAAVKAAAKASTPYALIETIGGDEYHSMITLAKGLWYAEDVNIRFFEINLRSPDSIDDGTRELIPTSHCFYLQESKKDTVHGFLNLVHQFFKN